ncbi:hypothetical protein [Flectobacillus longus]|uniref:hypothetical protein n=1 Tax=Flectobacillus longus TaxID=2984207 RepID=UPI0024B7342E|nr:hypothetical protein [Flectobacillus longus]MDI9880167.1 hypothetical protein [Flectobacillus longus]
MIKLFEVKKMIKHSQMCFAKNFVFGIQNVEGQLYLKKYDRTTLNPLLSKISPKEVELGHCIYSTDEELIFVNMFSQILKFDSNLNYYKCENNLSFNLSSNIVNAKIVILLRNELNVRLVGLFDIEKFTLLWSLEESIGFLNYQYIDKIFCNHQHDNFKILALNTNGAIIWQTQLNRNGKILNFLGVHEDVLVVCLQFGNTYGLMGLDINTGKILWNRDDWGLLQGHHTTMQNGKIFSLKGGAFSDSYYLEADIATVSLLRYGEVPNLKKHGFSIFNYTLYENFIYFTASKIGTSEATIVGVLAYDSLELLWWQEVELENGAFLAQKPQVDGDKLYILDTGGTLHIFEKEQA